MSDAQVRAAIEQMEAWLADPNWEPDPDALERWRMEFQTALAQAEHAPGWGELVARGHSAGQLLDARSRAVSEARDQVRAELAAQDRGTRALKGYGANSR